MGLFARSTLVGILLSFLTVMGLSAQALANAGPQTQTLPAPSTAPSLIGNSLATTGGIRNFSLPVPPYHAGGAGTKFFHLNDPAFDGFDANGDHFTMQITFGSNGNSVGAWGFTLSAGLQGTVVGGSVEASCRSYKNQGLTAYSYYKASAPANYLWHSSITKLSNNTSYQLSCIWQWPTFQNQTTILQWWFNYVLVP